MSQNLTSIVDFEEVPRLLERKKLRTSLTIREEPGVENYRIDVSKTLDGCYTSPTTIFEFGLDGYVSKSLKVNLPSGYAASNMKTSQKIIRVDFNLNDYTSKSIDVPSDSEVVYLRLRKYYTSLADYSDNEPVLVVPSYMFYSIEDPVLTLYGTAPGISAVPGTTPNRNSLRVYLPGYAKNSYMTNLDAASLLLMTFDEGLSYTAVVPNQGAGFDYAGGISKFILASPSASPVIFSAKATMVRSYKEKF